jgi:uncharacterized protein with HEPN domain
MPHKDDLFYLLHIKEAVNDIFKFTNGVSFDDFSENEMMTSAVIRKLEIIGEASGKISKKLREDNPDIPWRIIIDMRNVLIHHYFGVDLPAVWNTVKNDLPKLKKNVEKLIEIVS